jgi:hypothetical protein
MNSIKWEGDETIDDLYDHWIALVEAGNRAGLLKDLAHSVNKREKAHIRRDGDLEYIGPEYDSNDMVIIELAYGSDATKIIEMVRESDEHDVGDNLKDQRT